MAIWRGPGGPGDAVPDQANSAQLAENFANAAAASAASALTSQSNAAASAAAALVSESNASTSASQASSSESNAASSASAALASEQAAASSESNAVASEQAAALSESNAASSESNAASSEANALASEQAAALSESNAASSESNAAASESKAQQWATEAEDVPVETSPSNLYSAFHWAQKAEDDAQNFLNSDAYNITASDISNWDDAYSWGDHALAGYLTSYTETDPVFTAAVGVTVVEQTAADGAALLPVGTDLERPSPAAGMLRFNSDSDEFEGYNGTAWTSVGGAAITNDTSTTSDVYPLFADATTGTATTVYTSDDKLLYKPSTGELKAAAPVASNGIFVNATTMTENYTIATGTNGLSVGPFTIDTGVTLTIDSGQRHLIL